MSGTSSQLDIKLAGHEFRVACPPDEREGLIAAAELVDRKMRELAGDKRMNLERLAVVAALHFANEMLRNMRTSGFDIDAGRRRILDMQARLDTALNELTPPQ
ncbi:MAG: cell division protein ZapA [Rhodocyclaceae bacterium]|nr:cell division protein ZapA [Rhodocyclaceae bacterium]MBX3667388.1 cell division protein ZapA [Rhodocyclaceae bacterium]